MRPTRVVSCAGRVVEWMRQIQSGAAPAAALLPQLNEAKATAPAPVEGLDHCRALCFLQQRQRPGHLFDARQALLEELRLWPGNSDARALLHRVNRVVRPLLLPPAEVAKEEPLFGLLCDALLDYTMLTWPRLHHLYRSAKRLCLEEEGGGGPAAQVVECGVAGGGSAVMMAVCLAEYDPGSNPRRRVFALDTFSGMPVASESLDYLNTAEDGEGRVSAMASSWGKGTCAGPEAGVRALASNFGVEDRLVTLPGLFEQSLTSQLLSRPEMQEGSAIGLLHVDADWYASTQCVLETLVPRLMAAPRGPLARIVQVDDYHYWQGCRRAVDEYLSSLGKDAPVLREIDGNAVFFEL